MKLIIKLLINCLALVLVVKMVPGIAVTTLGSLVAMAIMLGVLNTFLRPMLILITLPLSILSLGLFTLIINGLLFYLAAALISGVTVSGFWAAFWGSLWFSIVSTVLAWFTGTSDKVKVSTNFRGVPRSSSRHHSSARPSGRVIDVESHPIEDEHTRDDKDSSHRLP